MSATPSDSPHSHSTGITTRADRVGMVLEWSQPARLPYPVVNTEWVVITGGPSSGKSSLLKLLGEMGRTVVPEMAERLILRARELGVEKEDVFAEHIIRQDSIFSHDLQRHAERDPASSAFLDRGLPDAVGYMHLLQLPNADEYQRICERYRYRAVCLLPSLPVVQNGVRIESNDEALLIHGALRKIYEELGYHLLIPPPNNELTSQILQLSPNSPERESLIDQANRERAKWLLRAIS